MQPSVLLALWLLLSPLAEARPLTDVDLGTAVAHQEVAVTVRVEGLGPDRLQCTVQNRTTRELRVRVAPGLHFDAGDPGIQDVFTFQERLLVLAPGARSSVRLWALCMQRGNHPPSLNAAFTFRGFADRGLQSLGDSLRKYPGLAEGYGQMFVWALTDRGDMYEVSVAPKLLRGATNVLRYLRQVTGRTLSKASVSADGRPAVKTFSKRVFVSYHNPTPQVASLKVYGADGRERYEVRRAWAIAPGVVRYDLALNAIVGADAAPVFAVRLLDAAGRVLHEQRVDDNTSEQEPPLAQLPFVFAFSLPQPVKNTRLRVRLPDGTLVEELKQLPYLPAGDHRYRWAFYHLRPAGTPFVVRLETAAGQVLREQPVVAAAP